MCTYIGWQAVIDFLTNVSISPFAKLVTVLTRGDFGTQLAARPEDQILRREA